MIEIRMDKDNLWNRLDVDNMNGEMCKLMLSAAANGSCEIRYKPDLPTGEPIDVLERILRTAIERIECTDLCYYLATKAQGLGLTIPDILGSTGIMVLETMFKAAAKKGRSERE